MPGGKQQGAPAINFIFPNVITTAAWKRVRLREPSGCNIAPIIA